MSVVGQANFFMTLTAILPGRSDALRERLESLPTGAESPLGRLERVHFGRWVIIPRLVYLDSPRRDELKNEYLLFAAQVDAPLEPFLDALREQMAGEADAIWGHCVGYPGVADREAFRRYMDHNRIVAHLPFAAYPDATLPEVREALELRGRLIEFAIGAQAMNPAQLYDEYHREFAS